MPDTSMNRNVFSYLDASGSMATRLAPADRTTFRDRFATTLHVAHGVVQKEYVTVPPALLAETDALQPWLWLSVTYAQTFKPQPTIRKA
jgi:hypothetical protein